MGNVHCSLLIFCFCNGQEVQLAQLFLSPNITTFLSAPNGTKLSQLLRTFEMIDLWALLQKQSYQHFASQFVQQRQRWLLQIRHQTGRWRLNKMIFAFFIE